MSIKTYDCTSGGAQWCQGCYTMDEMPDFLGKRQGDWVNLADYEKLEATLKRVQAALAQTSPVLWKSLKAEIDLVLS
jgi:hypothetical protein